MIKNVSDKLTVGSAINTETKRREVVLVLKQEGGPVIPLATLLTQEDIELLVRGKYNIHFNELEIKTFLELFFNIKGWTLGDKKNYIEYADA